MQLLIRFTALLIESSKALSLDTSPTPTRTLLLASSLFYFLYFVVVFVSVRTILLESGRNTTGQAGREPPRRETGAQMKARL